MHTPSRPPASAERGQVLVIVAAGMIGIIAMVALVIDGGYAWGQQRETQNGADAAAKAGAGALQQMYTGATVTNGDVGCAVAQAATDNEVTLSSAQYTDFQGSVISDVGACGSSGLPPAQAQGVKANAEQEFDTFLAGIVGFSQLTAAADATAVVAVSEDICPASQGCGVLPVTFPRTIDTCTGTNGRTVGEDEWEILQPENGDVLDASNLALLPLCTTGEGSVGWIDYGCGNMAEQISTPCNGEIPLPTWLQTQTGNPNCCENLLEDFTGSQPGVAEEEDAVLQIPIHDFTCQGDLADGAPVESCPSYPEWSGTGNGLHYHIPYAVGFKLDGAFTSGADPQCNEPPGGPAAMGNGATSCLKGWFVALISAPSPLGVADIEIGDPVSTGVLLIN